MTFQASQVARTAQGDLAKDAVDTLAMAIMQTATPQTQLEEDRIRITLAKGILKTSREIFPMDTAYIDDQPWEMLQGLVHL